MDRRVSLLLLLVIAVIALESTEARFLHVQSDNLHPIIYMTGTNNSAELEVHTMKKKFKDLSHDEFQAITDLKALIMLNQTISVEWLHEKDYLFSSATIKLFYLISSKLEWLPINAWARMPNLKFLCLANNHLTDIKLTSLKQLNALNLSSNFISDFSTNFLTQLNTLTHLKTLNLTKNFISNLSKIKSKSLLELDVSDNTIESIEENDLVNLPALKTLRIRQNKIKRIHPLAFTKMIYLTVLDLSNNENLKRLPIFEMSQLRPKVCGLFYFECSNCGIEEISPETFNAVPNLVYLNLAHNKLKILPYKFFQKHGFLHGLNLADNLIRWIPNGMFEGAKSLDFLNLEGNPLQKLPFEPFLKTPHLETLNVARCGLTHLWDTTNGVLKSLKHVFAANNSIKVITERELAVTPNIQELDLAGNPVLADAKRIAQLENQNIKLTTTVRYTESRLRIESIEKRLGQNSNESSTIQDHHEMLFVRQVFMKIITIENKTALDGIIKAQSEFAKKQQHILIMMGVVTGLVIISGLVWCLAQCSNKAKRTVIFSRNLLKLQESTDIIYAPLKEDSVKNM